MKVRFTRPALTDLEAVTEYVDARSPQGARRVRQRIKDAIEKLAKHPLLDEPLLPFERVTVFERVGHDFGR